MLQQPHRPCGAGPWWRQELRTSPSPPHRGEDRAEGSKGTCPGPRARPVLKPAGLWPQSPPHCAPRASPPTQETLGACISRSSWAPWAPLGAELGARPVSCGRAVWFVSRAARCPSDRNNLPVCSQSPDSLIVSMHLEAHVGPHRRGGNVHGQMGRNRNRPAFGPGLGALRCRESPCVLVAGARNRWFPSAAQTHCWDGSTVTVSFIITRARAWSCLLAGLGLFFFFFF